MGINLEPRQRGRLNLLDYTRFLAALMVVAYHWGYNGIRNGKISSIDTYSSFASWATMGYLGVHIFFMISGFVIAKSYQNKTAIEFAAGRFFAFTQVTGLHLFLPLLSLYCGAIKMG